MYELRRSAQLEERWLMFFRRNAEVTWLFVANLPNSGSTALAEILRTAPAARTLTENAEGMRLTPELWRDGRWNPDMKVNMAKVRKCWLAKLHSREPIIVIEKSPPNICRMDLIRGGFEDMPQLLLTFVRDPYAVCASWAKRYPPEHIRTKWGVQLPEAHSFYRNLGALCGQRFKMMAALDAQGDMRVTYEELTDHPEETVERLLGLSPLLEGMRRDAQLRVKDYAAQPLRNMNAEQLQALGAPDMAEITRGLAPYEDALDVFGYPLR